MPAIERRFRRSQARETDPAQAHGAFLVVFVAHSERAERAQRTEVVVAVSETA